MLNSAVFVVRVWAGQYRKELMLNAIVFSCVDVGRRGVV
jgi:hypothetical protein